MDQDPASTPLALAVKDRNFAGAGLRAGEAGFQAVEDRCQPCR
jgi:hypothetical protein